MNCVVCNSTKKNEYFYKHKIYQCPECSHIFYDGYLTSKEIKNLYSESYFKGDEYIDYLNDKKSIQKNFSDRLSRIMKYKTNGKLLEIGSAYGYFIELSQEYFECTGYEISSGPSRHAREILNLNVKNTDYLEESVISDYYDVVCMFDCIEHLQYPDYFLNKISAEIKSGGLISITTGDIGSSLAKLRGEKWRMIHPPTHIHYFKKSTIKRLLNKFNFKIIEINYPPTTRSLSLILGKLFGKNKIWDNIKLGIPLNTFDIMEVIAIKE